MAQEWRDKEKVRNLYKEEMLTAADIAERFGCNKSTVARWVGKHGIEKRSASETASLHKLGKDAYLALNCEMYLQTRYHQHSLSLSEIADELDTSADTVMEWMEEHNIPRRSEGGRKGKHSPEWKGDALERVCEVCGAEFRAKNNAPRRFCSIPCKAEWQSEAFRGEGSPVYNGGYDKYYGYNWDEQREKALERDGWTCQRCSMTREQHQEAYGSDPHVHHISHKDNFEDYDEMNKLSNLITLCASCHQLLEGLPIDRGV